MSDGSSLMSDVQHPGPKATVIVVTFNNAAIIDRCLDAIAAAAQKSRHEVVVVDNGSRDDTLARAAVHQGVSCVALEQNLGFAAANNVALAVASTPYVVLVNSDAFPDRGSIDVLLAFLDEFEHVGVVGGRLRNEAGTFEPSAGSFPSLLGNLWIAGFLHRLPGLSRLGVGLRADRRLYDRAASVDWVTAAYCAARRDVGLLPERGFMYGEDVEWAAAAHSLGYEVWMQPAATAIHVGNATVNQTQAPGFRQLRRLEFELRWFGARGRLHVWCARAIWAAHAIVRMVLYGLLYPLRPEVARRGLAQFGALFRGALGLDVSAR